MFYNRITIHKCTRFGLNKLDTITITPKSKTVLILGRNGCGKSSFTDIGLSILPIDKRHFKKGGYREQEITHNGNKYYLYSHYDGTHIYKKNGEVIYEGKVASVYRELVQEEFGINQRIHDLLLGKRRFTQMSPSTERREWITRLSTSDFNYVLQFYDRVRKEARACGNVIKHLKGRLATETAKIMDKDEIQGFRSRHDATVQSINRMFESMDNKYRGHQSVSPQIPRLIDEILEENQWIRNNMGYIHLPTVEGFGPVNNFDDLRQLTTTVETKAQSTIDRINELSLEQADLESKLRDNQHQDVDPVALDKEIDGLKDVLEDITKNPVLDLGYDIPYGNAVHVALGDFQKDYQGLQLLVDISEKASRDQVVDDLREKISVLEGKLSQCDAIIEHHESCSATECPKCKHEFVVGSDTSRYERAKAAYSKFVTEHKELQRLLEEQREWYNDYRVVIQQLKQLQTYQRNHTELTPLWYAIETLGGLVEKDQVLRYMGEYERHLHDVDRYTDATSRLEVLEATLQAISAGNDTNVYREQLKALVSQIDTLQQGLHKDQELVRELQRALRVREAIHNRTNRVMELYKNLFKLVDKDIGIAVNQELEEHIRKEQVELHNLKATISAAEVQQGIVNDLQESLDKQSVRDLHYRVLEQELSPTSGYIARLISEEIGTLLDVQNQLIKSIWKYPLTIQNCTTEDGDLTYRFPMLVGQHGKPVDDIKDGSTSMCDIIDFSFRLLVHKALEISNYPLVIDELERALDGPHRESLHHVIQSLTSDTTWGQVYVVSHYIEGMLSYPNAEFVVLDDVGLNLPFEYNQNVVIS